MRYPSGCGSRSLISGEDRVDLMRFGTVVNDSHN